MYFNSNVIPLSAVLPGGENAMIGSGFLVQVEGETYLVTAAHVANGNTDQSDKWSEWAETITLHDQLKKTLGQVSLFQANDDGERVPLFKYGRLDSPGRIADLIMIPMPAPEALLASSGEFRPLAPIRFRLNEPVALVGCHDWPRINTKYYFLRSYSPDLVALHIDPPSEKGESGGPVLNMSGELLGVNYGEGSKTNAPGLGLVVNADLLRHIYAADDGVLFGQKDPA